MAIERFQIPSSLIPRRCPTRSTVRSPWRALKPDPPVSGKANLDRDRKAVRENSNDGRQRAARMKMADVTAARITCCRTRAHAPAPSAAAPTALTVANTDAITVALWMTSNLIDRVRSPLLADPAATRSSVSPPTATRPVTSGSPRASATGHAPSAVNPDPSASAPRTHQHTVDAPRSHGVAACTSAVPYPRSPRGIENRRQRVGECCRTVVVRESAVGRGRGRRRTGCPGAQPAIQSPRRRHA